jgi:threonine dehydrogenase-like Zn-dependent dehydrogenase
MTAMAKQYAIQFTAKEKAELVAQDMDDKPLAAHEVRGRALVSLVSAGTEVTGIYAETHHAVSAASYPKGTGYAVVFEVEEVGEDVESLRPGDVAFAKGPHRSRQRVAEQATVKVPDGLAPERAVFARMMKVPMPTFVHARVRPPEKALVTGLGVVGLMTAQLARLYGYEVIACEPNERRRAIAQEHGVTTVLPAIPPGDPEIHKKIGLGLECSGHEQAVLDLCDVVRIRGEVFLVGVPWRPRTDLLAQKILHSVFYNYLGLHSGWEGQMPAFPLPHSEADHFRAALRWLALGRVRVEPSVWRKVAPTDPQKQYQDILHGRLDTLTVLFDWREM